MRTTMNLPDDLYRAARVRAAEEGRTVTSLLEEALRALLASPASAETIPYRVQPLTTRPGVIPFDVADNAATLDYLDSLGHRRAHS
jgi:plasmid stability protein